MSYQPGGRAVTGLWLRHVTSFSHLGPCFQAFGILLFKELKCRSVHLKTECFLYQPVLAFSILDGACGAKMPDAPPSQELPSLLVRQDPIREAAKCKDRLLASE